MILEPLLVVRFLLTVKIDRHFWPVAPRSLMKSMLKKAQEMKRNFRSLCMAAAGVATLVGCGPGEMSGGPADEGKETASTTQELVVSTVPPAYGKYRLKNGTNNCMQRAAGDVVTTAACTTATTGDQVFEVHKSPLDGFYTMCTPGTVKPGILVDDFPIPGIIGKCLEQKSAGSKDLRMMSNIALYLNNSPSGYFVQAGHIRDNGNGTLNWEGGGNNITRNAAGVVILGGAGDQQWTPILIP